MSPARLHRHPLLTPLEPRRLFSAPGPTATLQSVSFTDSTINFIHVGITYTDPHGINPLTIDNTDAQIVNGTAVRILKRELVIPVDAHTTRAYYISRVSDFGPLTPGATHSVALNANEVYDLANNPAPASILGSFTAFSPDTADSTGPTAAVTSAPTVDPLSATPPTFTVTFSDDHGVDPATITSHSLVARQGGGQDLLPRLLSVDAADPRNVLATYQLSITPGPVGPVTIATADAVFDTAGNPNDFPFPSGSFNIPIGTLPVAAVTTVPGDTTAPSLMPSANPVTGQPTLDITLTATDPSVVDATSFYDTITVHGPAGDFDARLVSRSPSGTTASATYRVALPSGAFTPAFNGTYTLGLTVPVRDAAENASFADQTLSLPITFPTSTTSGPQLTTHITPTGPIDPGSPITFMLTNDGTRPAKGKAVVRLYASADDTLDPSDTLITTLKPSLHLKPGQSKTLSTPFTYPAALPFYNANFLITSVDPTNSLKEQFGPAGHNAVVPARFQLPVVDLGVTFAQQPPTNARLAKSNSVRVLLTNHGNVTATTDTLRLFASDANTTLTPAATLLASSKLKFHLAPGKSKTLTLKYHPTNLPPGPHYLALNLVLPTDPVQQNDSAFSATQILFS